MRRTKSQIEKQYTKELRRIKQAYKRLEKIGYIIPENVIPKTPKKITSKSVERLHKITPEKIREKSEYIVGDKVVKYKTHKQQVKQEIKRIRKELKENVVVGVDYVPYFDYIERFRNLVESIPDTRHFYHGRGNPITYANLAPFKNVLISILDDRINEIGYKAVEKIIANNEDKISDYIIGATYDSNEARVENDLITVANIIKGRQVNKEESAMISDLSDDIEIDL